MTAADTLVFHVTGRVTPQGSKRIRGHGMVESSKGLPYWRARVTHQARLAMAEADWRILTAPCAVTIRIATAPRGRARGDIDKLARAILDSMTDAGVYLDDALVRDLHIEMYPGAPGAMDDLVIVCVGFLTPVDNSVVT